MLSGSRPISAPRSATSTCARRSMRRPSKPFTRPGSITPSSCFAIRNYPRIGELGKLARPPEFFPKGYSRLQPNIMMISNIRENGQTIGALPDGEMMFHHDMLHAEIPHNGTLLYSMEVPSYGGETLFASGTAAYDTLDPEIRNKLEGRKAFHHYNYGSMVKGDTHGVEAFAESVHPVFRTHEETGRKAIYVNR